MGMNDVQAWIDSCWPELVGAGRSLRANAPDWVQPDQWAKRPYRILIARLSPWQDVVQSSTHRIVYAILRQNPLLFPDMAFLPALRDTVRMTAANVPWWFGVGTRRAPQDFDCIAISNALVQEFINLPAVLVHSGIPLLKSERMADATLPLVILGGANSLHSSALWSKDPCIDGIFIGEEPDSIQAIFTLCALAKKKGVAKAEILRRLSKEIPGFFEPDLLDVTASKVQVRKVHASIPSINSAKPFEPSIPAAEISGVGALHIAEGCPSFCSFCAESYARKPYREVPFTTARVQALEMKRALGLEEIELFSFNFNNHSGIHAMIPAMLEDFGKVGLKSQRFDALAEDPELVGLMRLAGKASMTCGLEGISNRVRTYLQKGLRTEQLMRALEAILREPLRELKIFLIATGQETPEDFQEFREFLKWFRLLYSRTQRRPRIMFSATPLVRFPWTPLEFEDAPNAEQCGRQVRAIKDCVIRADFEFREAANEFEAEVSQILIRAKDARIFEALTLAQARTGFLYAQGVEEVFALAFREALVELGIPWEETLRGHDLQAQVPWRVVSPGVDRKFLQEMYTQSIAGEPHEICLGTTAAAGKCAACAACVPAERTAITTKRKLPELKINLEERKLKAARELECEVLVRVRIAQECAHWPYRAIAAQVVRGLMQKIPAMVQGFRRFGISTWEKRLDQEYCLITGEQVIPLIVTETVRESMVNLQPYVQNSWIEVIGSGPVDADVFESLELVQSGYFSPGDWLHSKGLKHTLAKDGDRRVYTFTKDALKKRVVRAIWTQACSEGQRMVVIPDDKFPLVEYLKNCTKFENPEDWRRIRLKSFYNRF